MLAIAKRAGASNETLYRWYGGKHEVFRSLVEENARSAADILSRGGGDTTSPMETIERLGPDLLRLVTGERAIALNRAAVVDVADTGTLGRTIARAGKGTIVPMVAEVLAAARDGRRNRLPGR